MQNTNNILKNSLFKAPVFNKNRYINTKEALSSFSEKLSIWNAHAGLSYELTTPNIPTAKLNSKGYYYIYLPAISDDNSQSLYYVEYQKILIAIMKNKYTKIIISIQITQSLQIMSVLYPFLVEMCDASYGYDPDNLVCRQVVGQRMILTSSRGRVMQDIDRMKVKVNFSKLVLFGNKINQSYFHLFLGDSRVEYYTLEKNNKAYINSSIPISEDETLPVFIALPLYGKVPLFTFSDLPPKYWPGT